MSSPILATTTNSLHPYTKKSTCHNSTSLNYHNECPTKYKIALMKKKNLLHRAYHISSSKKIFYKELKNIKQTLVNNNFPNKLINQQIKQYRHNIHKNSNNNNNTNRINKPILQESNAKKKNNKVDDQVITYIINRHIKPTEPQKQIKSIIYYTKCKTSNLIVKNNTNSPGNPKTKRTSSSSSSCRAASTDIPDPLSPLLPIVHRLW